MVRGFKAWANRIAAGARKDLGLSATDRLDCFALAGDLGIPVVGFTSLMEFVPDQSWNQLAEMDVAAFSAFTVLHGGARAIILNDLHHPNRQRSSVAHELAHALLLHEPLPVHGLRDNTHRDSGQEEEAVFLSGCLLVPEDACLSIVRRRTPVAAAARQFEVSDDFLGYRLRVSGALRRRQRELARRRS
ncbi:MAG: ImmA/IrrE family metallo-endopeptidase [Thermoleophilia bacterium]